MAEYSLHIDVLVGTNLYFEYTSIHYVFSVVKRKRGKKKKSTVYHFLRHKRERFREIECRQCRQCRQCVYMYMPTYVYERIVDLAFNQRKFNIKINGFSF